MRPGDVSSLESPRGGPAAAHVEIAIGLAQDKRWSIHCVATPAAVEHFLDLDNLAHLAGHPVRTGDQR